MELVTDHFVDMRNCNTARISHLSFPSVAQGKLCSMSLKSFNASSAVGFVSAMSVRRSNRESRAPTRVQSTIVSERKAVRENGSAFCLRL